MSDKSVVDRRHLLITAATGASVSGSLFTSCTRAATNVHAIASQRVHPVLIRNEHNELIRVIVEVGQPDVHATSFTLSLSGTDELENIETLRLFYTGDKGPQELDTVHSGTASSDDKRDLLAELTATPFGGRQSRAAELTFRGDQMLRPGANIFWLACKLRSTADLSHKVAAQCKAMETSQGTVTPSGATPGARKRIGVALRRHYDDGVHTYRIPALATTPKGTLLCVYDMRRRKRRDLQEHIDIGLSRSTDGGRTWEPPRVIMDMGEYGGLPQEQNGCSDPGIVVDQQTGEIVQAHRLGHKPHACGRVTPATDPDSCPAR